MANSKQKIVFYIAKIYLLLLPFGQLISVKLDLFGFLFRFHPVDLITLVSLIILIFLNPNINKSAKAIASLMVSSFSLLVSFLITPSNIQLEPVFYLVRLVSYFAMYLLITIVLNTQQKKTIQNYLLLSITMAAIAGWLQYLLVPDIRFLTYLGWDDHLFRLAGTFLDPGFTGYILILGSIISYYHFNSKKDNRYLYLSVIFAFSVFFTYSRASFLALFSGVLFLVFTKLKKYYKQITLVVFVLFVGIVILLPRRGGSGVELERVYSVQARVDNYIETIEIWKNNPLIGVGFNNLCNARNRILGDINLESNTCFGSDSSLLLVLATTGVIGFMIFADFIYQLWKLENSRMFSRLIIVTMLVHSVFVNSMFYTWIMGILAIFFATITTSSRKTNT